MPLLKVVAATDKSYGDTNWVFDLKQTQLCKRQVFSVKFTNYFIWEWVFLLKCQKYFCSPFPFLWFPTLEPDSCIIINFQTAGTSTWTWFYKYLQSLLYSLMRRYVFKIICHGSSIFVKRMKIPPNHLQQHESVHWKGNISQCPHPAFLKSSICDNCYNEHNVRQLIKHVEYFYKPGVRT